MRLGAQHGFRMMEYDVKLSRDGVPILLHDDTVQRTSGGVGNAADKTLAELAEIDFGAWHSRDYAGEPIPTLYSIAAYTRANDIHSNIEIKPHRSEEHTSELQSLMRISYAVFCLKKKKNINIQHPSVLTY